MSELADNETRAEQRAKFRRTLVRVLAVQVVALVLLAVLQIVYN